MTWKNGEPTVAFVPFDSKNGVRLLKEIMRTDSQLLSKVVELEGRFIVLPEGPGAGGGTRTGSD